MNVTCPLGSVVILLTATLLIPPGARFAAGQTAPAPQSTEKFSSTASRNIEDLNLLGADTTLPAFSDSILGDNSAFRRGMLRHGLMLRALSFPSYTQNTLDSPVPLADQVYVGHRGTWMASFIPILVSDLSQLHLRGAQLEFGASLQAVSWQPAGPNAAAMSSLYMYKSFGGGVIEIKAGYVVNTIEFIGLQVGGSVTSGAQGSYAVLPYEVGLTYPPLTSPSFNVRVQAPVHLYAKVAAQRSTDPAGGQTDTARDPSGFRFLPRGDKLLMVYEAGYKQDSETGRKETWMRAGYLYNTTPYANSRRGGFSTGNYCGFAAADHQFTAPEAADPDHGLYAGATAMVAAPALNNYSQYYEARIYQKAPFHARALDMASLVASRSAYSPDATRSLEAQGKTVWHNSNSITGAYSLRVSPGIYVNFGVSYVTGPAITPHVPNALALTVQTNFFF